MNIISKEDKLFALDLMKKFNIKGLRFRFDPSEKEWPDIWITDLDSEIPLITVTQEWQKQDKEERHKRLVHEVLHITGLNHGKKGKLNYSTYPEKDSYSKEIYEKIKTISNPIKYTKDNISNILKEFDLAKLDFKIVGGVARRGFSYNDIDIVINVSKPDSYIKMKDILLENGYKLIGLGEEWDIKNQETWENKEKIKIDIWKVYKQSKNPFIKGYQQIDSDEDVSDIDIWYDRHIRLWTIQYKNKNGDQIGVAEYSVRKPSKDEALKMRNPFLADLGTAAILGAGFTGGSILANLAGKKFLKAKNPSSAASVLNWVQTRFKNPEDIESYRSSFQDVFNKTLLKFQQIFPGGVSGRIKSSESIIEKLGRRNKKIEELTDIAGIRVVFLTLDALYSGLDKIRSKFNVIEEENYINQPRKGYRSYHLIIMVEGKPIEIQLKTLRMADWSEKAHNTVYKNRSLLVEKYGEKIVDQAENYMSSIADYYSKKDEGQEVKKPKAPRFWDKLKLPLFMLNPDSKKC
jgi:ppGpp synthetase/RelA/SpoT-type nucleotidyltranferase